MEIENQTSVKSPIGSQTTPQTYVFRQPRFVPFIIMLIPLTFILLLVYAWIRLHPQGGPSPLPYVGMVTITFGLVAMLFVLPKITITNDFLTQRNSIGHTGKPINLSSLTYIHARRTYARAGLFIVRLWAIKLIDENGNQTTIKLSRWNNEATMRDVIAKAPTGSNVDVNDDAQILHLN